MGKRSKQHRQDVISGKVQAIANALGKGDKFLSRLKDPYQSIKDGLTNSSTPESANNDFKVRTLNQLKVESLTYLKKYGDKEIAYKELFNVITSDKQYMDILATVGIDSEFISKQIRADLGLS